MDINRRRGENLGTVTATQRDSGAGKVQADVRGKLLCLGESFGWMDEVRTNILF